MPAGIDNPVIGAAAFTLVKLVGYALWFRIISLTEKRSHHWILLGVIRTVVGVLVGGALGYIVSQNITHPLPYYILVLPFIRFLEWFFVWQLFTKYSTKESAGRAVVSVPISYALDFPALYGVFMVGGFWVC